jgi:tight adherence protein B
VVSGLVRLAGEGLAVAGFAAVGYVVATPEPGRWRQQRTDRPPEVTPSGRSSRRFRDLLPPDRLGWRIVGSLAAGIVLAVVTSWPAMLLIGWAGAWFLPRLLAGDGGAQAQIAKVEAIATFTELLRDTLSAAAGLGQAIGAAATSAPGPIAPAAKRLAVMLQDRTVPAERALREFADRLADPMSDEVVIALMFAARNSASDLAGLLSNLALHARAEAAMRRRILLASARTQTAVRLITAVTAGMGLVLFVFGGRLMAPYRSLLGQLVLLAIAGLFACGYRWLAHLARPSVPPRLLRAADAARSKDLRVPAPRRPAPARHLAATVSSTTGRAR